MALHVASVEPALVALVWQTLLGLSCGVSLPWPEAMLVPVGVWLAYSADRHGDGVHGGRARHASSRTAARFWPLWWSVFGVAIVVGFRVLDDRHIVASSIGISWIAAYLALTQRFHALRAAVPREVVVGLTFAVGTTLFASPFVATVDARTWVSVTLAFAALCTWSCLAASWLEREADRRCRTTTIVTHHALTRRGIVAIAIVLGCALSGALAVGMVLAPSRERHVQIIVACALTASFACLVIQIACARPGRSSVRSARWTDFLLLPGPLVALGILWASGSGVGEP